MTNAPDPVDLSNTVVSIPMTSAFGDLVSAVEVAANIGFVQGRHRFSCTRETEGELELDELLATDGIEVLRAQRVGGSRPYWEAAVAGDGWAACVEEVPRAGIRVRTYATDDATAVAACDTLSALVREAEAPGDESTVPMRFHYLGERGVCSERRMIDAPEWDEIARNYPQHSRELLGELVGLQDPGRGGRLVLMHGPPGTGKTTVIRSLVRAWRPWCDASYVMDPEVLFSRTSYLNQLVLEDDVAGWTDDDDESDDEAPGRRWRLLVIEDADEIISGNARDRAGQALSRLLNLTDGLLGQGLRTLVLITTNEPVSSLHPALTRPGRCLAEIEVPAFDESGAREWLDGNGSVPKGGATLAELFALSQGGAPLRRDEPARPAAAGMYL